MQRDKNDCIALMALCIDYFTRICAEIDKDDSDFGISPTKLKELSRYVCYFDEDA